MNPTQTPSEYPSFDPTTAPSVQTSVIPSNEPSVLPTAIPTPAPSEGPSFNPTAAPSAFPSVAPISDPTLLPSVHPSDGPTISPSEAPTVIPSISPTVDPTMGPTMNPTVGPSQIPSLPSTAEPTLSPSVLPTFQPSLEPTQVPSLFPTTAPTKYPSVEPTLIPTRVPSVPPSIIPSKGPSMLPTMLPTVAPSLNPSVVPSKLPTLIPSSSPVTVVVPVRTSAPSVEQSVIVNVLTTSFVIGACDNMILDLTSSSGSVGSAWKSISYSVQIVPSLNDANLTSLITVVDSLVTANTPMKIPASALQSGHMYKFSFTLCNVLNLCSSSKPIAINVTDSAISAPVVLISGSKSRTMIASTYLSLSAVAYVNKCGGKTSTNGLQYAWKVFLTSTQEVQTSISSISKDLTKFKSKSNVFTAGESYDVVFTVIDQSSGLSSEDRITVIVSHSPLVAKLNPSTTTLLVRAGSSFSIDGKSSYDPDSPFDSSKLIYLWNCVTVNSDGRCALILASTDSSSTMWFAAGNAVNTTSRISLLVVDSSVVDRNASTSILVTVVEGDAPVVSIKTDPTTVQKVNTLEKLSLAGSVVSSSSDCVASWRVEENWLLSLSSVAIGSYSTTAAQGVESTVPLTILANSMLGRESYTFVLSCGKSSTSIIVKTNGAPYGGSYVADPSSEGIELSTTFLLSASMWMDEDLPLTYQFGFYSGSSSGQELVIRSKSELNYATTTLPAGLESNGYALNVTLKVYDSYSASISNKKVVVVKPMPKAELQNAVLSSLQNVSTSTLTADALTQLISVSSAALNRVECSGSPDCSTLNRESCSSVANTCGSCISGFVGEDGYHNSMCVSYASLTASSSSGSSSGNATVIVINKQCPQDCSAHGQCYFYPSSTSTDTVTTCSILSTTCVAKCTCDEGYASSSCSMTTEEISMQQSIRSVMLQGLSMVLTSSTSSSEESTSEAATTTETIDEASALSAVSSITSIIRSVDDLSEESAVALSSLVGSILDKIDTTTMTASSVESLSKVLSSLDTLLNFQQQQTSSSSSIAMSKSSRRLLLSVLASSSTSSSTIGSLTTFSQADVGTKTSGEAASSYLQANFRIASQIIAGNTINTNSMILPQSTVESVAKSIPTTISVGGVADTSGDAWIQAIQLSASAFTDSTLTVTPLQSSVLLVKGGSNVQHVIVTIPFSDTATDAKTALSMPVPEIETHDVTCVKGDTSAYSVTCSGDGSTIPVTCSGKAGIISIRCPRQIIVPSCAMLTVDENSYFQESQDGLSSETCKVMNYTSSHVRCNCSMIAPVSSEFIGMRKLSSSNEDALRESGFISTGLMIKYIGEEFAATMVMSDEISIKTLQGSIIVLVMFGLFWAIGFLAMLLVWRRKRRLEDRVQAKKMIDRRIQRHRKRIDGKVVSSEEIQKKILGQHNENDANHQHYDDEKRRLIIADRLLRYITSALPAVYKTSSSFLVKVKDELLHNHLCLNLFFGTQEGAKPWLIALLELLTMQTMMMFMLALLYDLQGPDDDGSCVYKLSESTCVARKSILDSQQSYCSWEVDTSSTGGTTTLGLSGSAIAYHCVYNPVDFTPLLVTYVAAITSICTALIGKPLSKLFEILAAPTEESIKATIISAAFLKMQQQVVSVARRASAVAIQLKNAIVPMQAVPVVADTVAISRAKYVPKATERAFKEARTSMEILSHGLQHMMTKRLAKDQQKKIKRRNVNTGVTLAEGGVGAQIMEELKDDLTKQRDRFATQKIVSTDGTANGLTLAQRQRLRQRKVFDEQWGLTITSSMSPDQDQLTQAQLIDYAPNSKDSLQKTLLDTEALKAEAVTSLKSTPEHQRGLEILQLFIKDLLGRDSSAARIFKSKVDEDYRELPVVKVWYKHASLAIIVIMNCFFIYFSILRGYSRGVSWQRSYMLACVMQFLLDMLLFETLECVWVNVLVPSVVTKEVNRIHMILHVAVQQMVMHAMYEDDDHSDNEDNNKVRVVMNAPDYLFVSTKVAKAFPQLMESVIVLSYQSYMPGEIAHQWGAKSIMYDDPRLHQRNIRRYRKNDGIFTMCLSGCMNVFSKFCSLLVTFILVPMMSRIPLGIQKLLLRFVQPFILGGLAFLYYTIVTDLTYLIITAIIIALIVIAIGYKILKDQRIVSQMSVLVGVDEEVHFDVTKKRLRRRNDNVLTPAMMPNKAASSVESKTSDSEQEESRDVNRMMRQSQRQSVRSSMKSSSLSSWSEDDSDDKSSDNDSVNTHESIAVTIIDLEQDEEDDNDLSQPLRHPRRLSRRVTGNMESNDDNASSSFEMSDDSDDSSSLITEGSLK